MVQDPTESGDAFQETSAPCRAVEPSSGLAQDLIIQGSVHGSGSRVQYMVQDAGFRRGTFCIGHDSVEPSERDERRALRTSRVI